MKTNKLLALLVIVALVAVSFTMVSFAAVAAKTASWSQSDVNEINNHNPSAQKTYLGERLLGLLTTETSSFYTSGEKAIDLDDRVVRFYTPADYGISEAAYGDGEPKQQVSFVLVTDGGTNVVVTPTTSTGFTSVTMDSAGDTCSLTYQDDTIGWIVSGNNSCTVAQ